MSPADLAARYEWEMSLGKAASGSAISAKGTAILCAMLLTTCAFVPLLLKATRIPRQDRHSASESLKVGAGLPRRKINWRMS